MRGESLVRGKGMTKVGTRRGLEEILAFPRFRFRVAERVLLAKRS